jgi:hypothetical protein
MIVKKYNLKAVAHVKLLAGQTKLSCTKITLKDAYYCFSYISKKEKDSGTFLCGSFAAKDFLELAGIPSLPLFNPLVQKKQTGGNNNSGIGCASSTKSWDSTAKQLADAINLIVVCWDIEPNHILANIKETINKYCYKAPYLREIKAINTIISKDPQGRTLQQMLLELRANNTVRKFNFGLLNDILLENDIESNYG